VVRLSVNVNKIALIRNSRGGNLPDVLAAARICLDAGCYGITVHPRPDARHITYRDVHELSAMLNSEYRTEFNVEGYPSPEFIALIEEVRPTQATLVPDLPGALTSDAGWRLGRETEWLRDVIARLRAAGIRVSLFVEPDESVIRSAKEYRADRIELYTGPYAHAFGTPECEPILARHRRAAALASEIGLGVNAGHDLDTRNLPSYIKAVPDLLEVSIGHALISDALYHGLSRTVRLYLKALGSRPAKSRARMR
jgi:pyridoxine 5-phosphate synthase